MRMLLACLLLFGSTVWAAAESLVVGLSDETFGISSSFVGGKITVFGTIERDAGTIARRGKYDVAIVVRGPRKNIVTRKKSRVAGIWVNLNAEVFPGAPSYYATLSSSPLGEVATPPVLVRNSIGTSYLALQPQDSDTEFSDKVFLEAMIRLKKQEGLYHDIPDGVRFLAPLLFSATIPLPENVIVGDYTGEVFLFRDGGLLARQDFGFTVRKEGFEQLMYDLAHNYSLLYGIGAVLMAFFTGWAAGVIFRKD